MTSRRPQGYWRIIHWGPLLALTVIFTISTVSMLCTLMWWPVYSIGGFLHMTVYMGWLVLVLYHFFNASFIGPGLVPLEWKPENPEDTKYLQYCSFCEGYKAPRSHHCRKCDRCVMKMDHHCPWINNCVGHKNHASFTYFLLYAPVGCVHSLFILIPSMYRAVYRNYYVYYGDGTEPIVTLSVYTFIGCMFSVGLAIGVIVAVGVLFFIQIKSILKNESGIESWIIEKAKYRLREEDEDEEFVYPYNLGRKENLRIVFRWDRTELYDGYTWPVREGCDQFTLTLEQIKQKKDKRDRSVLYEIRHSYSGAVLPITKGFRVCCCPPCTDEPRIKLDQGDKVLVTRWKKHWLYGDKLVNGVMPRGLDRVRGWFPRQCAIEVINNGFIPAEETKKES